MTDFEEKLAINMEAYKKAEIINKKLSKKVKERTKDIITK